MFYPRAYRGRALLSLLADLDRVGDLDHLPKAPDWHLIDRHYGGVTPDPTELPTTTYRCEQSTATSERPRIDLPNIRLDEYIAGGAFGWVYAASIISTGFVVAVKILKTDYADSGGMAAREALIASSLRHPQILSVYDINRTPRYWVIIMELVRGSSFKECAANDVATLPQLRRLASALRHMAEHSIVHRDIKPGNIVLRYSDRTPVLIDFGLAVNTATYAPDGLIVGTPYFMCPEALDAQQPAPAFDAYSLGVTYCSLLLRDRYVLPPDFHTIANAKRDGTFEAVLLSEVDRSEDERLVHYARRLVDRDPETRIAAIQELASSVSHGV
jgi:serine/threonine protein kinase